jgi:hypothetical protein
MSIVLIKLEHAGQYFLFRVLFKPIHSISGRLSCMEFHCKDIQEFLDVKWSNGHGKALEEMLCILLPYLTDSLQYVLIQ